jgi:DNA polymerase III sliding clamp (beta) subunit (PCNA family)
METVISGNKAWFVDLFKKFAPYTDRTGYNKLMGCLCFDGKNNRICALAGHQIAIQYEELKTDDQILIPMAELEKNFKEVFSKNEYIELTYDNNEDHVNFISKDHNLKWNIEKVKFFEFDKYFDCQNENYEFTFDGIEIKEALKNIIAYKKSTGEHIPVILNFYDTKNDDNVKHKRELVISYNDKYMHYERNFYCDSKNEITIGFNPDFLLNMIDFIDETFFKAYVQGSKLPIIAESSDHKRKVMALPVNIIK